MFSILMNLFNLYLRFELELELHIACAILNDSLYEPLKADKVKVVSYLFANLENGILLIKYFLIKKKGLSFKSDPTRLV